MSTHDGGPAFPFQQQTRFADTSQRTETYAGMSLRDYFAIHAPEPSATQVDALAERERLANPHNDHYKPLRHGADELRAILRYRFADAMLAVRKETQS